VSSRSNRIHIVYVFSWKTGGAESPKATERRLPN